MPVNPLTRVGTHRLTVVPSPSAPMPFQPQHIALVSTKTAHETYIPRSTADIAAGNDPLITGVHLLVVDPSPS